MAEQFECPKPKHQRFAVRRKSLPRGPDGAVRCDKRQMLLELEAQR
jgi:hypothetical protein